MDGGPGVKGGGVREVEEAGAGRGISKLARSEKNRKSAKRLEPTKIGPEPGERYGRWEV